MRLGRINIGRALLFGATVVALALGLIWSQRRPIAAGAIDRALAARGVTASYVIKDIGVRTQRIENVRIGDPANPDLTADWAEVSLAPTWPGIGVYAVSAGGVRLRGRVVGGRLSWGEVDKLLGVSTSRSFSLPDVKVRLSNTQIILASEVGTLTATIAGSGQLSDGFKGRLQARALSAGRDGCRLHAPIVDGRFTVTRRMPQFVGTLRAARSTCGTFDAGPSDTRFDVTLTEALDGWRGSATVATEGILHSALQLAQPRVNLSFAGTAKVTRGSFNAAVPATRYGGIRLVGLSADGSFSVGGSTAANGRLTVETAIADPASLGALRRALGSTAGTPVGPIADAVSHAIGRAGEGVAIAARFDYGRAAARISHFRAAARGGAVLTLDDGAVTVDSSGFTAEAGLKLAGGGFPSVQGRLARTGDGSTRGIFVMTPFRAGTAQLKLAPVQFAARRDGTMRVESAATLDGPIGGGRAEGVQVPLVVQRSSSNVILIAPGCTLIAYRRIALSGTTLAANKVTLCPTQGGALLRSQRAAFSGGGRTGPIRLTGRVGTQALVLASSGASFELGGPISLADLAIFIGSADRRTQLKIAGVEGVARANDLSGRYTGMAGHIAHVPILASNGQGSWTFARGVLDIGGKMMLADEADQPRFKPLSAEDVKFRLKGGHIAGAATLHEPISTKAVATVTLTHELSRGVGEARISVAALNFSKSLQPEALSSLTLGVVADVYGQIDGSGIVRWTNDQVTSSGKFRTDTLDMAAAFGPVTGASGEIDFDDLIGLSTPPGQQIKLAVVNPGVEVRDGVIAFQLLPNRIVEIERGDWPFAGGKLLLGPASLDFGQTKPRTLSFHVVALDAAKFIEQLKLENIAATGTFDGTLPIVFDGAGSQIVGGQIVARVGGGTLAYVGDVSNAQTNALAKLAFDALKSIRYRNLAIDLNGALDGEIVSLVRFDGVNQSPVVPTGIAKSLVGLPFKFNIRVRAPFRGLANTARSFQDPGRLLNGTVQPVASDHHQ